MKVLTLNFVACAAKACRAHNDGFPLHPKEAELAQDELPVNRALLANLLPRLNWPALRTTAAELGFPALPDEAPSADALDTDETLLADLHNLLINTQVMEGALVCAHCGHEYAVREGITTFLLPNHLV